MTTSNLDGFINFLSSNPDIEQSCASASSYNDVAAIAKANGFEVSGSDLVKLASTQIKELRDEQLESISGGGTWTGSDSGDEKVGVGVVGGVASGTAITIGVLIK